MNFATMVKIAMGESIQSSMCYCDYIADLIKKIMSQADEKDLISKVGPIRYDLHPIDGYMVSTKKTIDITDRYGKMYKITIEEVA
jgi:hypothetical protein